MPQMHSQDVFFHACLETDLLPFSVSRVWLLDVPNETILLLRFSPQILADDLRTVLLGLNSFNQ